MRPTVELSGKNVLLLGKGFFGGHIYNELVAQGYNVFAPSSSELNLLLPQHLQYPPNRLNRPLIEMWDILSCGRMDGMIICSCKSGGYLWNKTNQHAIYGDNLKMGMAALDLAQRYNVGRTALIATSCSYDCSKPVLYEEDFLGGVPDPSVFYFGMMKRALHIYARSLYKQYGRKIITLGVTNLMGEGDTLDLHRSKVVGAMIMKMLFAQRDNISPLTFFSDGTPRRQIMHATHAAKAVVKALEVYDDYENILNIGVPEDYSLYEIAHKIKKIIGYEGEIVFGDSSENGQMKKMLSIEKMNVILGEISSIPFEEALANTISDYKRRLGV